MKKGMVLAAGLALGMIFQQAARADLVFTAPPRESRDAGQEIYGPLAEAMTRVLGEKVVYKYPKDFQTYSKMMREGDFDILFDGPHFASWRIEHLNHKPLVRLPGVLEFVVVTASPGIEDEEDLVARRVCSLMSPNLATLSLLHEYDNPAREPIMVYARGGMRGVYRMFRDGKCDAAVLRTTFYEEKLAEQEKKDLEVIFESQPAPNQVITAGPNLSPEAQIRLARALVSGEVAEGSSKLFRRFSKDDPKFVEASPDEYLYFNLLLESYIWGW